MVLYLKTLELAQTAQVCWEPLELDGGGMGCCSLVCFRICFCTIIERQVLSVEGNDMGAIGAGVSSGNSQLAKASHRAGMAWSWAPDWSVGTFMRESVSVVIPRIMRSYGVTTGLGMVWWRNSTVSKICSDLVLCGMIRWH